MSDTLLAAEAIFAQLDGREILTSISLDVRPGEFFSLLGPSGCGKTTLLRIIAGFLQPTSGRLLWLGKDITHHSPQLRDLNLVFQNYALFPHLNVFENVAFGLRIQKLPQVEIEARVHEALTLVRMESHSQRRVTQLSGGQQQRIALARAIAPRPKLVLLDEPLGALDLQLRKEMQWELKSLQRKLGMTFIYVTHDQEEAFSMSDRIALLNRGKIEQVATPENLYSQPCSKFVAEFIGTANFIPVERIAPNRVRHVASGVEIAFTAPSPNSSAANQAQRGELLLRPEQLCLTKTQSELPSIPVNVQMRQFLGATVRYHVQLQDSDNRTLLIDRSSAGHEILAPGEPAFVQISASQPVIFSERINP